MIHTQLTIHVAIPILTHFLVFCYMLPNKATMLHYTSTYTYIFHPLLLPCPILQILEGAFCPMGKRQTAPVSVICFHAKYFLKSKLYAAQNVFIL